MPFTMIHLHVAMRAAGSKTEKKEEFLLGSIAPDAVHYLPDYTSSYKCRSHLLPDGSRGEPVKEETMNCGKKI